MQTQVNSSQVLCLHFPLCRWSVFSDVQAGRRRPTTGGNVQAAPVHRTRIAFLPQRSRKWRTEVLWCPPHVNIVIGESRRERRQGLRLAEAPSRHATAVPNRWKPQTTNRRKIAGGAHVHTRALTFTFTHHRLHHGLSPTPLHSVCNQGMRKGCKSRY
jgi:hypothetical protein